MTRDTFTVNTANNRLTAKNSIPFGYDAAGNQTTFSTLGLNDYEQRDYDAENRMSKAIKSGLTNYYFYDANGKRVRRIVNGTQSTTANETWMVYGFDGELVAEYAYNGATGSPQKEYGYRNGQMLIVADNSGGSLKVRWEVAGHLGSPRMSIRGTGSDGGSLASVTRHDYLPFGEEVFAGARRNAQNQGQYGYEPPDDGVRQCFTGYERDDETGLDYAQARYYASGQGRFTGVDPMNFGIAVINPQNWNRYVYALNNPLTNIDRNGKWPTPIHDLIIEMAFPGLSDSDRRAMKLGSQSVDVYGGVPITMFEQNANQHAMSRFGQSKSDALKGAGDFIQKNEIEALRADQGNYLYNWTY